MKHVCHILADKSTSRQTNDGFYTAPACLVRKYRLLEIKSVNENRKEVYEVLLPEKTSKFDSH